MLLMSWITVPIFSAVAASVCTVALVRWASSTARSAICDDCATWPAISRIEIDSSSVAAATVCTLAEVWLRRRRHAHRAPLVWSATPVIDRRRRLHLGRRGRKALRQHRHVGLELARELVEHLRTAHLGVALGLLLGRESACLDRVILEDLKRPRQLSDLVLALCTCDAHREVAIRKPAHGTGHHRQRPRDTVDRDQGDQAHGHQQSYNSGHDQLERCLRRTDTRIAGGRIKSLGGQRSLLVQKLVCLDASVPTVDIRYLHCRVVHIAFQAEGDALIHEREVSANGTLQCFGGRAVGFCFRQGRKGLKLLESELLYIFVSLRVDGARVEFLVGKNALLLQGCLIHFCAEEERRSETRSIRLHKRLRDVCHPVEPVFCKRNETDRDCHEDDDRNGQLCRKPHIVEKTHRKHSMEKGIFKA